MWLALGVALCPAAMAGALNAGVDPTVVIVGGLIPFGIAFAMNSAVHSYLILAYAEDDKVAMNVGFYYMANACGRLARHDPLRTALPMARPHRVPVDVGRVPRPRPGCCPSYCRPRGRSDSLSGPAGKRVERRFEIVHRLVVQPEHVVVRSRTMPCSSITITARLVPKRDEYAR